MRIYTPYHRPNPYLIPLPPYPRHYPQPHRHPVHRREACTGQAQCDTGEAIV